VTGALSPAAARRVFLALTATRWFPVGLTVGLLTLWPLERGLTVPEALAASSLAGLTVFLLELPTSGFADAFGRRPVYVAAAVAFIASAAVFYTATAWWQFAVAAVLTGAFRALDSGPLDAWFVDTVHASNADADVDGALSAQGVVLGASIAVGALLSGGLVWWHPFSGHSALLLPGVIYVGLTVVHLGAVLLLLREPPRGGGATSGAMTRALASARQAPLVVRDGLHLLRHSPVLRGLVAVEAFWAAAMVVFETFQPIRLAELLGSEERAAAAGGGWALFALGSALAGITSRRLGVARTAILARVLNGLGALTMGLVAGPVALVAAYAVTYTLHGGGGPMHAALLHREATSANRATVLSINSMVSFLAYSAVLLVGGLLAGATSTPTAMVALGAVSVLGAACYLPALQAERRRGAVGRRPSRGSTGPRPWRFGHENPVEGASERVSWHIGHESVSRRGRAPSSGRPPATTGPGTHRRTSAGR
jgi:predicted MFS family arabinose efflux permease